MAKLGGQASYGTGAFVEKLTAASFKINVFPESLGSRVNDAVALNTTCPPCEGCAPTFDNAIS